jgi:hypothetical protein
VLVKINAAGFNHREVRAAPGIPCRRVRHRSVWRASQ